MIKIHVQEHICMACHSLPAPRPECTTDPECLLHLACIQQRCQDPCTRHRCGVNAECKVNSHRAYCVCKRGYEGNPETLCEERKDFHVCFDLVGVLSCFFLPQPGARATRSAEMTRLASGRSVRTLAFSPPVEQMLCARREAIVPTAFAFPITRVTQTSTAGRMSAW